MLARYGRKGKRYDTIDITQHIAIQYDTIRCINATSNLTRSNTGVSSSTSAAAAAAVSLAGTAGRRSQRNSPHGHVRRRSQTLLADQQCRPAISASTRMATPPWLTDRSSAVCGRARSTTLYKGIFRLRTLTDVGVHQGRTSMSDTARQRASTSVDMRERMSRTSTHVTRHRTLTDT